MVSYAITLLVLITATLILLNIKESINHKDF